MVPPGVVLKLLYRALPPKARKKSWTVEGLFGIIKYYYEEREMNPL